MTQTTIEVNLVDVLNKIDNKIDRIDQKLDKVQINLEKLKSQNEQIVKRIDNVETGINTMTLGFVELLGVLITGLLTIVGKITFFPNP